MVDKSGVEDSAVQKMLITPFEEMTSKSHESNESLPVETFDEFFASEPYKMEPRIQW